jgi:hypothetical protein
MQANRTQQQIIQQLREELGASEGTEHLIDWLIDAWETLEHLRDRFGEARAMQLYTASVPEVSEVPIGAAFPEKR